MRTWHAAVAVLLLVLACGPALSAPPDVRFEPPPPPGGTPPQDEPDCE